MNDVGKKVVFSIGILLLLISNLHAATPAIQIHGASGYGFIKKSSIGVTNRATLRVSAIGASSVARVFIRVGGVLFQGTASPEKTLLNKDISLSFKENGRTTILNINIGNESAVSNTPAWIWVPAAKFANSLNTAALSLYGKPETNDELKYHMENKPRFWVDYHPILDDTLIGMMIFAVDGMFVDVKPERLRNFTQSLSDRKKYFGDVPLFNNNKSFAASVKIKKILNKKDLLAEKYEKLSSYIEKKILIFEELKDMKKKMKLALVLKSKIEQLEKIKKDYDKVKWSTYMMNDVNSKFVFNISNGILNIDGVPNYHFGIVDKTTEDFTESKEVTNELIKNRGLFFDLNPFIYASVDRFAKLVAFFNYVELKNPKHWKKFMMRVNNENFSLPIIDTPAAWNPN